MKKITNWGNVRFWIVTLGLSISSTWSHAQAIEILPASENYFSFGIVGADGAAYLGMEDLVYYHFSDGSSVQVIANPSNPNAMYRRQFAEVIEASVIAYIARKNGPLEFAPSGEVPIVNPCGTCQDPVVVMPADNPGTQVIRLSTSWQPFSNPNIEIEPFLHDITAPAFSTPDGEAWFFLNMFVEESPDGWFLNPQIKIPEAFSVAGVVVKGNWAALIQGGAQNITVVSGSEFKSIRYNEEGNVEVKMERGQFDGQAKLSLLMKGNPGDYLNTLQMFRGIVRVGEEEEDVFNLPIRIGTNPHDPNKITAKEDYVCTQQKESDPYKYVVDFQNTGEGYAEDIFVHVDIDPTIMDAFSIQDFSINASHDFIITEVNADQIIFKFKNIQLPGTLQEYPHFYTVEETMGRIAFKLRTIACLIPEPGVANFYTSGEIKFLCCYDENDENPFVEITPLAPIEQKLNDACELDTDCHGDIFIPDGTHQQGASIQGYPNPFTDQLSIITASMALENSGTLELLDVNGFVQINRTMEQGTTEPIILNTENLSSGIYFVRINNGNETKIHKFIKQ